MDIKRILIVRTDRIGDVVLSTPVITAARQAFPDSYIAVMVSPITEGVVAANPYLNEVIVYDKKLRHRGLFKTLGFARGLKRKGFDLALILHSTSRVNLICFLAGVRKRVGYARGKMDFLLTDKLAYEKRLGEKHESEYSLDLLRSLDVKAEMSPLIVPVGREDEDRVADLLQKSGLKDKDKFVVLHAGASSVSKMWPAKNFAEVGDILAERFGVKIVLVSSMDQIMIGERVRGLMKNKPIFLCGKTSLKELAALFKMTSLFISNDSGPVHIACAIGTPVISIFSRNNKGLSPVRWGPIGAKAVAIHKDVGCVECLAHNCNKGFLCLNSVTVQEIVDKASEIL